MSKWGNEETKTIEAINNCGFLGNVLNVAAGDGRFLNILLENSKSVTAIDINGDELETLKNNCPPEFISKLKTEVVDITNRFPYQNETYDSIFCTGTLHLFDEDDISFILNEMKRCIKQNGVIILDFATDIKRFDKNGNEVIFKGEGNYKTDEAVELFNKLLYDYSLNIQVASFSEKDLVDVGYNSITGNFLVVTAKRALNKD